MAKNDHSDLGFVAKGDNNHSDLGFQPSSSSPSNSSTAADALRGAEQGLTFGAADEGGGLLQSLLAKLPGGVNDVDTTLRNQGFTGDLVNNTGTFGDVYTKGRDENRELDKQAATNSPWAYGLGQVGGGVLGAAAGGAGLLGEGVQAGLKAPGLAGALKVGAVSGALSGAGNSEADLTKGETGKFAKDVIEDTGLGMGVAGALHGAGAVIKGLKSGAKDAGDLAKDQQFISDAIDVFKREAGGEKLAGQSARRAVGDEVANESSNMVDKLLDLQEKLGKEKGAIVKNTKVSPDLTEELTSALESAKDLPEDTQAQQSAKKKVIDFFNNKLNGRETETIPEKLSARQILEEKAARAKASASALGQNLNTDIVPSTDDQGKKLLTLLQSLEENTGASERAVPFKDAEGLPTGEFSLNPGDTSGNFKSSAKASTVLDTPGNPAQTTQIPGSPVADFSTQDQFRRSAQQLTKIGDEAVNTPEAQRVVGDFVKSSGDKLTNAETGVPALKEANSKYSNIMKTLNELGILDNYGGKTDLDKSKTLSNLFKRTETDNITGDNARQKLDQILDFVKKADPKTAEEISSKMSDLGGKYDLIRKINNEPHNSGKGLMANVGLSAGNALTATAYAGRTAGKITNTVKGGLSNVAKQSPEWLKSTASAMVEKGGSLGAKAGEILSQMPDKDQVGKNAMMFAAEQNPGLRKFMKDFLGTED